MKKTNNKNYIILCILFIFLCYIWFVNMIHIQFVAIILTLFASILFYKFLKIINKMAKSKNNASDNEQYNNVIKFFIECDSTALFHAINDMLKASGSFSNIKNENNQYLLCTYKYKPLLIKVQRNYPDYETDKNELFKFYSTLNERNIKYGIYLTTSKFSKAAESFIKGVKNIQIELIDKNYLYTLFKKYNMLNMIAKTNTPKKTNKNNIDYKSALSPDRSKYYIIYGILLILLSFFTSYKIYYIILSALSFALAAASKLLHSKNKITDLNKLKPFL